MSVTTVLPNIETRGERFYSRFISLRVIDVGTLAGHHVILTQAVEPSALRCHRFVGRRRP
jgi:hypothetical protein